MTHRSLDTIISDIQFARSALLKSIEGLSRRELTQTPIYDTWTIKDVLAHFIGWDQWGIRTLPLINQDRAGEIPRVDVEQQNQRSISTWRDKSLAEVLGEIQLTHQQFIKLLSSIDDIELDRRHERNGRVITIRSFVIDITAEHERQHAAEIELWQKALEEAIDPDAIRNNIRQSTDDFMNELDRLGLANSSSQIGDRGWSIHDLVGHMADWAALVLAAANHIHDHARPVALSITGNFGVWDKAAVSKRAGNLWETNYDDLRASQLATTELLTRLEPEAWRQRGPYPWHDDHGTLAELLSYIAEHYADHLPDLKQ